jgi:hypothetical protein
MGRDVHGANCPWGELFVGRIVRGVSCPWGELSVGRNVRGASCPWGELSVGQDVVGRVVVGRVVVGRVFVGRVFMGRVVVGRVSMGRVVREPLLAIPAKKTSFQLFSLFYVDPGKILFCWNVVIYSLALDSYTLHLECTVYRSCTNNRNSTSTPSNQLALVYSVGASLHSSTYWVP